MVVGVYVCLKLRYGCRSVCVFDRNEDDQQQQKSSNPLFLKLKNHGFIAASACQSSKSVFMFQRGVPANLFHLLSRNICVLFLLIILHGWMTLHLYTMVCDVFVQGEFLHFTRLFHRGM